MEKVCDGGELFRQRPIGGVAGEADQVERAILDQLGEIVAPSFVEDAAFPPGLTLR